MPTKEVIRDVQTLLLDQPELETPAGLAYWQQDGVYRVMVGGERVCGILAELGGFKHA